MNDRLGACRRALGRLRPLLSIALAVLISLVAAGCVGLRIATEGEPVSAVAALPSAPTPAGDRTAEKVVEIALGDPIQIKGSGASVDGSTVRITSGGTYRLSGTLRDGQVVVDTQDGKLVKLILDGADITSSRSAPIHVARAKATVISLPDGTKNRVADGGDYGLADPENDEPNAAIFSKGNLTIEGGGSLTVEASFRDGVTSKDELTISGGDVTVRAANDGVRGRDFILVRGGRLAVNARADGLRSNNDVDPEKGYVAIEGGAVAVTAGADGIQAQTSVAVRGGTVAIATGGGSAASGASATPAAGGSAEAKAAGKSRGIKALADVTVSGGTITVDSSDDAINANGNITISDGVLVLAAGDDGIHSDAILTIGGGDVRITRSVEAIEGAVINVNGGSIRLTASDDGVNVAEGSSAPAGGGGSPAPLDLHLSVTGGYVVIDALGDGLDVNGWAKMTGGTIIVHGPLVTDNGALDYAREWTMAGGTLVAVGSFGMAQAPDATSTQRSLVVTLQSPAPAGTLVHVAAEDGTALLTFAPLRAYQSVVYSSPELRPGTTYNVFVGGSATGDVADGVYSGGTYTPGVPTARITASTVAGGIARR